VVELLAILYYRKAKLRAAQFDISRHTISVIFPLWLGLPSEEPEDWGSWIGDRKQGLR